ncbi:exopolyphosphatase PRUNE1 [Battus philenor]|uniref:exopolyphosphatase PRUNE1 n=1 Tax=Battus philenor TaxID=42288 RepID=UPI0035CF9EEF
MDQFLATTAHKLRTNDYSELTIVLGNESCDLDSAVSAIVYAMFLSWQYEQIKCKVCTKTQRDEKGYKDNIFVPVLDVARSDYNLKTEVAYCLRENGASDENLLFRNDIDMKTLLASNKTKIILVDHHILSKRYNYLSPYVTEIIDHRPIDRKEWTYKDDTRSTIETVGSCATLVAQRIKDLSSLIKKDVDFFTAFPECTDLLHCAVVLDTVNFCKEVNKGTAHDKEIVLFLESIIKPDDNELLRKSKLDRLVAARSDVTHLTASELLKKDVKVVGDVLVPSFPVPVKEFLKKPGALLAVAEALVERDCTLALLLGMRLCPGLQRDAAVYAPNARRKAEKLAKHLQDCVSPSFQLVVEDSELKLDCLYFSQANLLLTRKQYMPVLAEFLQHYKD